VLESASESRFVSMMRMTRAVRVTKPPSLRESSRNRAVFSRAAVWELLNHRSVTAALRDLEASWESLVKVPPSESEPCRIPM
jgi:hypothetical protein